MQLQLPSELMERLARAKFKLTQWYTRRICNSNMETMEIILNSCYFSIKPNAENLHLP